MPKVLVTQECDMLILDEILGAVEFGIITEEEVEELIRTKDEETELILTGNVVPDRHEGGSRQGGFSGGYKIKAAQAAQKLQLTQEEKAGMQT